MVSFYYKIVREPMLRYKKTIKMEVGKRQDIEMIEAKMDMEIKNAREQFEQEIKETSEE